MRLYSRIWLEDVGLRAWVLLEVAHAANKINRWCVRTVERIEGPPL